MEESKDELCRMLTNAVVSNDMNITRSLLEEGVSINVKDENGSTLLMLATERGHTDMAEILIERGADVNEKGGLFGDTPLMCAAFFGHFDMAELLIEHGAKVNEKGGLFGGTALMYAIRSENLEIAKLLLCKGADLNAKDKDGNTMLRWAMKSGKLDSAKFLYDMGAKVDSDDRTSLMLAAMYGGLDGLLCNKPEKKVIINEADEDGRTLLMWASMHSDINAVEALIKHGADVKPKDNYGNTALSLAEKFNHPDIVKSLRDNGAKE